MPNLYPVFDMPELAVQQQTEPAPQYARSWFFDFEKGDFARDNTGRVMPASGYTAWAHWCIKAILTERYEYLAYGSDYGCETKQIVKLNRDAAESEIERVITEALLADERTQIVRNFIYDWHGDEVAVTCDIVPVIGTEETVRVKIGL